MEALLNNVSSQRDAKVSNALTKTTRFPSTSAFADANEDFGHSYSFRKTAGNGRSSPCPQGHYQNNESRLNCALQMINLWLSTLRSERDMRALTIFLIGRFIFDYIGDPPITRTDEGDFIIFDEEHVGSSLWHFLYDLGREVGRAWFWMFSCGAPHPLLIAIQAIERLRPE